MAAWASTGLAGLDAALGDLRKGDNVVWQVDRIEDYQHFVTPYVARAKQDGRSLIYMRFADHVPLLKPDSHITVYNLDADTGFETFSTDVHSIIAEEGKEAYYVFDCLSDLLSAWATDLMIGNFFMIT
ncbi:MAG: PEP/pyruvate-binding domain-containing protein, partial [Planctomycetota bacterium]